MKFIGVLLVVAVVFGICFLVDKGFTKIFRSKAQHKSGLAVRLSKRYGSIGAIMSALGVAAVFMGIQDPWVLIAAGAVLVVAGICLVVYYLTFGIYYDDDTFLISTFGKPDKIYRFQDIQYQQLYIASGHIIVELTLSDGRVFQVQSGMEGMYPFMDHAFAAWLRQKGLKQEDCEFYDPQNSCWFPVQED